MRSLLRSLLIVAVMGGVSARSEAAGEDAGSHEQLLQSAGLTSDGATLLEFFRTRSKAQADGEKLQGLVRQFAADAGPERIQATTELISWGPLAVPALRPAANNPDNPELAGRARKCLQWLEGASSANLAVSAARVLAVRKPDGAAAALLDYLPYADSADVAREVSDALADVAFTKGKADPAVLKGLGDQLPLRRAAACNALCKANQPEQWPAVRKLMSDPSPTVRLKAALSLAEANDVTAIPVLIELLGELPLEPRRPVEEFLGQLAGEWAPGMSFQGEDEVARRVRRDTWAAWWRNADGPALMSMLRRRTLTDDDKIKIRGLIKKLGDEAFESREKASAELTSLGSMTLPLLREATRSADLEISKRANDCIRGIKFDPSHRMPTAAVRLLALRRPEGAAGALLAYLPFAEDEGVADESRRTLVLLATAEGKPEAALVKALSDADSVIRGAAAEALAKGGGIDARPEVRKLLKDRDLNVRAQVALALIAAGEKEAVPVLIDLLSALPPEQVGAVEDSLYQLAGEKAPQAPASDADAATKKKYAEAWSTWWKDNGDKIDLAKLEATRSYLGLTLIVEVQNNNMGRVVEIGRDGKERWHIDGLQYPVDAWVLGGGRVLVAEYNGRKVTERDMKGKILWEKSGYNGQTVNVQRMPNGNTFIASDQALLEVDRTGKELFMFNPGGVTAAYKSRSGHVVALLTNGRVVKYDTAGKEVKGFQTGRGGGWTSGIDLLANGRILVAQPNRNKVVEYDGDGKQLLEVDAPQVTTATGLPNGNILVASYGTQRVFEVDRKGKVVWEHKGTASIFRARRR
jgi:HEAT repeat protein